MTVCDMCGKSGYLVIAEIEGADLTICKDCAKYGKNVRKIPKPLPKIEIKKVEKPSFPDKELVLYIVSDYSKRVKEAREKLGLKQEALAKKLAERESLVQKIECGNFEPSMRLARKLENNLGIILIKQHEEEKQKFGKTKLSSMTIGDMIKIKKRK